MPTRLALLAIVLLVPACSSKKAARPADQSVRADGPAGDTALADSGVDTAAPDVGLDGLFVEGGGADAPAMCGNIRCDCSFNGTALFGKYRVALGAADLRIREVNAFPDLKVEKVTAFPDSCGKWQEVSGFADFTVRIVTSGEDFTVQYVKAFPGVP